MSVNLDSLRINVKGIDFPEVERIGREIYGQLYLHSPTQGVLKTHDGYSVFFFADSFDYGFFTRSQWRTSSLKDIIDRARVERVKWIREFIAGTVSNSQCWEIPVGQGAKKRLYLSTAVGYVVWLNPRRDGKSWSFKTAYSADPPRIWEYTREVKGSKLIGRF